MPLMNGGNLEDAILDTDVETVKAVMKPLLHATEKMHGLGIIHGDLKPTVMDSLDRFPLLVFRY